VKRNAIPPTLLTLGNAICGFAAIAMASKAVPGEVSPATDAYLAASGWLIIAAMVFDSLDGYVARLSRSTSNFGLELDSLCDAISFGLAPAFLLLKLGPGWEPEPRLHQALAVIAVLYLVCAILRLARFNVETTADSKRFRGLPSPAAAGCLASLAILRGDLLQRWFNPDLLRLGTLVWAPLGAVIVAVLMVSRVPYPHLTKQMLGGRRRFRHLVEVILLIAVLALVRDLAVVVVFWVYALGNPLLYFLRRSLRHDPVPHPATGLDERLPH
jgi:CDP-diacylglycerol--serine O-phosphatidyltransferase